MVAERSRHLFEVEVRRSDPGSSRETQKKALVGVLVCVLALAAAVALVAPDGRGISIHGAAARHSVSHRVVMSGSSPLTAELACCTAPVSASRPCLDS